MMNMREEELIAILMEDTEAGMAMVIDLYGDAIKTICYSILKGFPEEDIQEAIADTFVGLWSGIANGQYDVTRNAEIKFYLYGIARKTALNKRRKLMKKRPVDNIDEVEQPPDFNLEKEMVRKADYEVVNALIHALNSPDKEIFLYRYYKQYSIKEISEQLKLPAKIVENKLTRGRKKLKIQLLQCGVTM